METLKDIYCNAKKEHKCNFCGGVIPVGERYHLQTCKYDGIVYDWKSHRSCDDIAYKLDMFESADDGLTREEFNIFIREEYFQSFSK